MVPFKSDNQSVFDSLLREWESVPQSAQDDTPPVAEKARAWNDPEQAKALHELSSDWLELKSSLRNQKSELWQSKTGEWEAKLTAMVAEQQQARMAGLWVAGPHDLLSIVGRARRELFHTAILAWLLDPLAPHGLGSTFLQWFLAVATDIAILEDHELLATQVQCEVSKPRSRADIVINTPSHTIVIEAKVDAVERPKQCDDLYADWSSEQEARFVFLTPKGRDPGTATGEAKDAFRTLSFKQIHHTLKDLCTNASHPDARGRITLLSYSQTLEAEFYES